METTTLYDFETLNAQLTALVEAGVPLDVGLAHSEHTTASELEQINAIVARRMARGESLAEALEGDERDVPGAYRGVMQLGIHGNVSAALSGSSRVAEVADDSRFALRRALSYPLIVCTLAYVGLIGFCLFSVPVLTEVYDSLHQPAGIGFRVLHWLRETLRYWAPIPPLVLLVVLLASWRSRSRTTASGSYPSRLLAWIPGASQIQFQERCSRFATSLAALLDKRLPLGEAVVIAADTSGDTDFVRAAQAIASEPDGTLPNDRGPVAMLFPPFLRWAIWHSEATTGRARALEIAARTYHEAAERRLQRLNSLAPIVVLVGVGGVVTLLYCLAIFLPFTELLEALAH